MKQGAFDVIDSNFRARIHNLEKGVSLISTSIFILVLGMVFTGAANFYDVWKTYDNQAETNQKLAVVQKALHQYLTINGRYPCPASLTAALDTPEFGTEVTPGCAVGAGTFLSQGTDSRPVITGTVPVRALSIADRFMIDGYNRRFIYAVTQDYAQVNAPITMDDGDITILDGAGNNASSIEGNIVQIVYSTGLDDNGAYSVNGVLIEPCDTSEASGENCDFAANATFTNTPNKSIREDNLFVHNMSYRPARTQIDCDAAMGNDIPKDIAYLVDSSGSMRETNLNPENPFNCPAGMWEPCSRIDVARWAMRKVIPSRMLYNTAIQDPGETSITDFARVRYSSTERNNEISKAEAVYNSLGNIVFDDPTVDDYEPPEIEDLNDDLERELQGMCPSSYTPLGDHIAALAEKIGDGEQGGQPNKIVIISDGLNTAGADPLTIVQSDTFKQNFPNVKVDIIDVVGNPQLSAVANETGGNYYSAQNPDELLNSLLNSSGICNRSLNIELPPDVSGCGTPRNAEMPDGSDPP